jgi:hypothetical protein
MAVHQNTYTFSWWTIGTKNVELGTGIGHKYEYIYKIYMK